MSSATVAEADPPLWTITFTVPARALDPAERALDAVADAVSIFRAGGRPETWRLTGYARSEPDAGALAAALALAARAYAIDPPAVEIARAPETDWLALNRRSFAPVRAGRFVICPRDDGGVDAALLHAGDTVVRLNAGPAFGSGAHGSTRGCLIAFDRLARLGRPRRVLDLGTGSGLLAIAAASLWRCPVVATDIDPVAVRTALKNARVNHVEPWITAATGPGFRAVPAGRPPFDLIAANILARPLAELAGGFSPHLAPGGRVVLSGLTTGQEWHVLPRFRAAGLRPRDSVQIGEWITLVLARA